MESLKPLKIIGALALLCLAIFLAFPNGRLNTLAALRSLGIPKYDLHNSFKGKYAKFLERQAELTYGNDLTDQQYFNKRGVYCEEALQFDEPRILGIASRNLSNLPIGENKSQRIKAQVQALLEQLRELANKGHQADPDNAFFLLQLGVIAEKLGEPEQVKQYIESASNCEYYDDYGSDEAEILLSSLVYAPSITERAAAYWSVSYPQFANQKSVIKGLIGATEPKQNLSERINAIKIGKIMAFTGEVPIAKMIGRSIIGVGISYNFQDSYRPKQISLDDLIAACPSPNSAEANLITESYKYSTANIPLPREYYSEDFEFIWNISGTVTKLPIAVLIIFAAFVLLLMKAQKVADRRWIKPIRYLALVPLTLCLAQSGDAFNFHFPTVITILAVSIPIALITFTEKFVPIIHVTIVAISVYFFERNSVLSQVLLHVSLMAVFVILTWHKNRTPESKLSKPLSFTLVVLALLAALSWTPAALNNITGIATLPMVIGCILLSTLAIVNSDRQTARSQATVAASLGLSTFAATALFSLTIVNRVDNILKSELLVAQKIEDSYKEYFSDLPNNPPAPDVKKDR